MRRPSGPERNAAARHSPAPPAVAGALWLALLLGSRAPAACLGAAVEPPAARAAADVPARPSAGCRAPSIETGRRLVRTLTVGGVTRSYILDVPERLPARDPVPLLFDFHGFGHSAAGVWKVSEFRALARREKFITAYPDGLPVVLLGRERPGWEIFTADGNRDLLFTARLLDHLERAYCIDRARVFATGFSNGAFFSTVLACTMWDRFAAVAPVSGGRIPVPCAPGRGVPVLILHGRGDRLVPVEQARQARDAWVEKNRCREQVGDGCEIHRGCRDGAQVAYCEGDFAHRWPADATGRIWEFFRRHPLPSAAVHRE